MTKSDTVALENGLRTEAQPVGERDVTTLTGIRVTTLDNGLRVATDRMDGMESASVGVWVGVGARNERPEVNGVAHLLEHMLFKGTRRRNARQIAEEIEAVGGHLNAYTGRENTAYYAKVLKDDVPLAVDMIGDMLQHSLFDEGELAREREVVLQEIGQANDTPDDVVFDHFQATAFPDQALGRPVLGTDQTVGGMSRQALVDYVGAHYGGETMILTGAGAVDHDALVELARRHFADLPRAAVPGREPARYQGGDFREDRDLEQTHLVFGFDGVPHEGPEYWAMQVLSTALGGGMSSRLFQEVREKRGLVYSIYSFASSYADDGLFGIYAGTGPESVGELVPVVCDEVCRISEDLTEDELRRARAQLKAGTLMGLESTMSRAEQLSQQLLIWGRPLPTPEVIAHIDAVDVDAVRRAARHLRAKPPTLTALGPLGGLESYDRIAARLS